MKKVLIRVLMAVVAALALISGAGTPARANSSVTDGLHLIGADAAYRRSRAKLRVVLLSVLALALFVEGKAASAATVSVDCTANSGALAAALMGANDGDVLAIQGTCMGTFEIADDLTLTGSGGATLDGQGADTVLTISPGKTVVITDLIVTGGHAISFIPGLENGGGIWNNGTLTITNSTVSGNSTSFSGNGGGIYNLGTLTLINSTVSGNTNSFSGGGAGIWSDGTLTITNSIVSGNSTSFGQGGGIYTFGGTMTLSNSAVSDNTSGFGGGITNRGTVTLTNSTASGNTSRFGGSGGGIANLGTLTLTNSTVSGNTATFFFGSETGGGIYNVGPLTVENTTISANSAVSGGGLFAIVPATLVNTIVAGQTAGGNCAGASSISDDGYNIEDGMSCGFSSANNSLPNTNPLLDPAGLSSNGGPTQTIALQSGSPAINAIPLGVNGCGTTITTDQRGVSRPQGSGCDIGAFELEVPTTEVSIDVKPETSTNPIKLSSNGLIPVAILTTDTFDATTVDPSTVCFGDDADPNQRDCTEAHGRGHLQDIDADGDLDMLLHFEILQTGIDEGDTSACLSGSTVTGVPIEGCDSVRVLAAHCVPPPPGLVGWWPGNGSSIDIVGGRDGTLEGDATFAPGMVGQAFDLDGDGDFVEVADDDAWTFGDFSIDLWVKFRQLAGRDAFLAHDEGGGELNKWIYWFDGDGVRFHINDPVGGPVDAAIAPISPDLDRWYHVAITRRGSIYSLYIDGSLVASSTDPKAIPDAAAPLTIGAAEGAFFFNGLLDEVEIFDRALSASQVRAIFAAGSSGKCAS